MKPVFICSPYAAESPEQRELHCRYARRLCRYAVDEGFAPFAPHLLFTQFLDDVDAVQRSQGLRAGKVFLSFCRQLWFGVKHGISDGMKDEIEDAAKTFGIPIYLVLENPDGSFTRQETEKLP